MLSEKIAKAVFNEKFKLDIEDIPVREQLEYMRFFVRAEVFSAVMPEKPYIYEILQKMIGKLIKTTDWIPVTKDMPEEKDTWFAKYWGTDRWNKYMFRKRSDLVEVTVELDDGTRVTEASRTRDGKWAIEEEHGFVHKKVVAWKPMSAPWKEGIIG